ncbi:MAG: hypothetical protein CMJ46_00935 [Planctomyces sp.]|nr:hypothetical protein [Planctomyces sp.]
MNDDLIKSLEDDLAHAKAEHEKTPHPFPSRNSQQEWGAYQNAYARMLEAERKLAAARHEEYAADIAFPLKWCTGAPCPILLANDYRSFLTFFVAKVDPDWDGTYTTVSDPADSQNTGVGVVEFDLCVGSKLGDPNDEVFHGHPLHGRGMRAYTAQEVINSRWIDETDRINSVHSQYSPESWKKLRHYVFWFHDSTFECLAMSFKAQLRNESMPEVLQYLSDRLIHG